MMDKETIETMLGQLAELRAQIDLAILERERIKHEILGDLAAELTAVDLEFAPTIDAAESQIEGLEGAIRDAVGELGESVRSGGIQAVFSPGRVTWDAKALDGFALNHPELFAFRREGKPSVSIRGGGK